MNPQDSLSLRLSLDSWTPRLSRRCVFFLVCLCVCVFCVYMYTALYCHTIIYMSIYTHESGVNYSDVRWFHPKKVEFLHNLPIQRLASWLDLNLHKQRRRVVPEDIYIYRYWIYRFPGFGFKLQVLSRVLFISLCRLSWRKENPSNIYPGFMNNLGEHFAGEHLVATNYGGTPVCSMEGQSHFSSS